MDSNKDFARSKRKATQRHKPGRGEYGPRRSTVKAELGTNEERYQEDSQPSIAAGVNVAVPRSQGADMTSLLQENLTEFRQRGTFYEDVDSLPTPTGQDTSTMDLNIDMQGLADSLVNLPIWNVLDLDAALCQSFLPSATQEATPETSNQPLDHSTGNGDLAKTNTNKHSNPQNASDLASDLSSAAASRMTPAQTEATATSSDAHAVEGHAAVTLAVRSQGSFPAATVQQTFVDHQGRHAPSEDGDALDLDDLLNTPSSMPHPASTAIAKAGPQDQDNLEDWLNSL